jgi:mono/diheme cytochrome c family protein
MLVEKQISFITQQGGAMKRKMQLGQIAILAAATLLAGAATVSAQNASPVDISSLAGRQLYALKKCGDCHNQGAAKFTPIKAVWDSTKLAAHVEELKLENVLRKDTSPRRQKRTFGQEIMAMVAYLKNREKADAAPKNFVTAGYVMIREDCRNCHTINGVGKEIGPKLDGVGAKHDKKWMIEHFTNPQAFVKDSVMPAFDKLPKEELEAMADYLLASK